MDKTIYKDSVITPQKNIIKQNMVVLYLLNENTIKIMNDAIPNLFILEKDQKFLLDANYADMLCIFE